MKQGEHMKRKDIPTLQQLYYLIALEEIGVDKGNITLVAERCGVNYSSVSRYLKTCQSKGYITNKNEFTKQGQLWLDGYKEILKQLPTYLESIGIAENAIEEEKKDLIENIDYYTLSSIVRNGMKKDSIETGRTTKEEENFEFLSNILEHGTRDVGFMLYRINDTRKITVSMADKAFHKPASLTCNKRGKWLYLKLKSVHATSRVNGIAMKGQMESLRYEKQGILYEAQLKDDTVRIPLDAFQYTRRYSGEIRGGLLVMVTCNVGRIHMPESTALLSIWL